MPIQREGDFLVTRDLGTTPSVGIESGRLSACIDKAKSFAGIFGSPSFDFRETDLNFLDDLTHLRQIWFWNCEFSSIEGIYTLQNLEYCGVMQKRPGIDYSRFPCLETAVVHWNPNDSGFGASTIRNFRFWHYKPRSESFEGASFPPEIEELELNWVNPPSLTGIPVLPKLRRKENKENKGRGLICRHAGRIVPDSAI